MFCFYARHNAWDSTEAATLFRSSIVAMVLDARRRETQPEDACNLSASAHGLRPCHPPYLGSRSSRQSTLRLRAQNPPHPIPASNDCLRTDPPLFQRDFGRTMLVARLAHEIHGRGAVADGHLNQRSVAPTTACGPKRSESTHSITLAAGGRVDSTEAAKPNITGHHHSNRTSSIQKAPDSDPHVALHCEELPCRGSSGVDVRKREQHEVSRLEAIAGDVLVLICSYIQPRDIGRLSTVSRVLFDEGSWKQLHLMLYGVPQAGLPRSLPLAHASRIHLQSDFPVHHSRLVAIRHHHWLIRSKPLPRHSQAQLHFVLETLRREDTFLREKEKKIQLMRADSRREQHTRRAGALRDLSLAKKSGTEERMLMVDMRAAVERHAYAPGLRPKAPQPYFSREGMYHGGGGGKAMRARTRSPVPSLAGVFCEGS